MEGVMSITLLDFSYEFYYAYHGFKATLLEDFAVLAPLPQRYDGMWKPKGCVLVVLGLCDEYAKGLLRITFNSSKVLIFVTAGSMRTPHNWMRVKWVQKVLNFFAPNSLRESGST